MSIFSREPKVINLAARPKKKPKAKTRAKRAVRTATTVKCSTCGKRYSNPLAHTCTVKSDFKQRQRAAERERAASARRAKRQQQRERAKGRRKKAADRRKAAAADRRAKARSRPAAKPRAQQHDYRMCNDDDCRRTACQAFRDGIEACPLEHGDG